MYRVSSLNLCLVNMKVNPDIFMKSNLKVSGAAGVCASTCAGRPALNARIRVGSNFFMVSPIGVCLNCRQ